MSSPKYGWEDITRNSIGLIHSLEDDGDMGIAFCFRSKPFSCSVTDVEKVPPFELGQEIHVMSSVSQPRLGWSDESPATVGKVVRIDMDGALNVKYTLSQTCFFMVVVGQKSKQVTFGTGNTFLNLFFHFLSG